MIIIIHSRMYNKSIYDLALIVEFAKKKKKKKEYSRFVDRVQVDPIIFNANDLGTNFAVIRLCKYTTANSLTNTHLVCRVGESDA